MQWFAVVPWKLNVLESRDCAAAVTFVRFPPTRVEEAVESLVTTIIPSP